MSKYQDLSKEELLKLVEKQESELASKKYGLVWDSEKEPEKVVLDCENNIPVLKRVKEKEIRTDMSDDNILIEGDNYHALTCLNYTHKGKIDVIYIDPPYNTGNKDFVYNDVFVESDDSYKHSKWLNFMNKRLRLSKTLLKPNGAIFCSIDDKEYPRLTMLLEEIYGEGNIKTICVKMSEATGVKMASVIKNGRIPKLKEYLVIAKNDGIKDLYLEKLPKEKWDDEYKMIILNAREEDVNLVKEIRDNESRTKEDIIMCDKILNKWNYVSLSDFFKSNNIEKKDELEFKYKNAWRILRSVATTLNIKVLADKKRQNIIGSLFSIETPQKKLYIILKEYNAEQEQPRIKILFADDYLTQHPGDFWTDIKTTGLDNEGGVSFKNGKKPLKLIEKVLKTYKSNNISVLDFFAGSGTTGEAVLKLNKEDNGNRKFILCTYNEENGTKVKIADEFCYPRIKNAIKENKGNIQYFRADLIPVQRIDNIDDKQRTELTEKAGQMIAIKENTFDEVVLNEWYQIFETQDKKRKTAIYFRESQKHFQQLLEKIGDTKTTLYIFSYGRIDKKLYRNLRKNIVIEDIPEPILEIYKEINLTLKK